MSAISSTVAASRPQTKAGKAKSKAAHIWKERLLPWLLPLALILGWEFAAKVGWLSSRILPEPLAVARAACHATRAGDRAQTQLAAGTPLGLVEMTRKRTRESLGHLLCEPCPACR